MIPVLIFGPFLALIAVIVFAIAQAAADEREDCEAHWEREELSCLPLTEMERIELDIEMDSITREAACHR